MSAEIKWGEGLVVGPDDVLILKVSFLPDEEEGWGFEAQILEQLESIGLSGRALLIVGDNWEMAKVKR